MPTSPILTTQDPAPQTLLPPSPPTLSTHFLLRRLHLLVPRLSFNSSCNQNWLLENLPFPLDTPNPTTSTVSAKHPIPLRDVRRVPCIVQPVTRHESCTAVFDCLVDDDREDWQFLTGLYTEREEGFGDEEVENARHVYDPTTQTGEQIGEPWEDNSELVDPSVNWTATSTAPTGSAPVSLRSGSLDSKVADERENGDDEQASAVSDEEAVLVAIAFFAELDIEAPVAGR